MITNGFVGSNSGVMTVDTPLDSGIIAYYVYVLTTSGQIVWKNQRGELQYLPNADQGIYIPIAATEIVSSGIVDGGLKETTAVGFQWVGGNIN